MTGFYVSYEVIINPEQYINVWYIISIITYIYHKNQPDVGDIPYMDDMGTRYIVFPTWIFSSFMHPWVKASGHSVDEHIYHETRAVNSRV